MQAQALGEPDRQAEQRPSSPSVLRKIRNRPFKRRSWVKAYHVVGHDIAYYEQCLHALNVRLR